MQQDKFEDADIKYDNISGNFQPRNTQIRHFWSLIWELPFLQKKKLKLDKLEGADFKYENTFSTVQPKYPNRVFLVASLFFFVLDETL